MNGGELCHGHSSPLGRGQGSVLGREVNGPLGGKSGGGEWHAQKKRENVEAAHKGREKGKILSGCLKNGTTLRGAGAQGKKKTPDLY